MLMAASAWGMISRPDWIGREAQADLVEQRQQERHAADAEAGEEAAADRRAEGADAEQAQLQQRKRSPLGVQTDSRTSSASEIASSPRISPALSVCSPKISST